MNINQALAALDPHDDDHWTADGLPRVDVVAGMVGAEVKRQDITNADPQFSRMAVQKAENGKPYDDAGTDDNASAADPTSGGSGDTLVEAGDPAHDAGNPEVAGRQPEGDAADAPTLDVEAEATASGHELPPRPNEDQIRPLEAESAKLTEELKLALQAVEDAKAKFKALNAQANTVNRRLEHLHKADPNHNIRGIKDYLRSQNNIRLEKAKRTQALSRVTGMTGPEIVKELKAKSPLDQALSGRKAPLGSGRPNYPASSRT